ncbi:hypothetical protein KCU61_g419, partial [Aureobasidium melanogenum]
LCNLIALISLCYTTTGSNNPGAALRGVLKVGIRLFAGRGGHGLRSRRHGASGFCHSQAATSRSSKVTRLVL